MPESRGGTKKSEEDRHACWLRNKESLGRLRPTVVTIDMEMLYLWRGPEAKPLEGDLLHGRIFPQDRDVCLLTREQT